MVDNLMVQENGQWWSTRWSGKAAGAGQVGGPGKQPVVVDAVVWEGGC